MQVGALTPGNALSGFLHGDFAELVKSKPAAPALLCGDRVLTYGALGDAAIALARRLQTFGLLSQSVVAVVVDGGWEPLAGIFGILGAGASYVCVEPGWSETRLRRLFLDLHVAAVVTPPRWLSRFEAFFPEGRSLAVARPGPSETPREAFPPTQQRRDAAAWWELAGVSDDEDLGFSPRAMSHRSGVQMLDVICRRCRLDDEDRALLVGPLGSLAALPNLFGLLRVGGTLIVPEPHESKDPRAWWELIEDYEATMLSVTPPALNELLEHVLPRRLSWDAGRVVMLATDWIPVQLPGQLRRFASGAKLVVVRENPIAVSRAASLVIEEVDPDWACASSWSESLRSFFVLDENLKVCPPGVPGHLYLRESVAPPAWRSSPFARHRFSIQPETKERVFRTGHLGRQSTAGAMEFAAPNEYRPRADTGERVLPLRAASGMERSSPPISQARATSR